MSRIGKLPINIPQGVEINVSDSNIVSVKGKLGAMQQYIDPSITLDFGEGIVTLRRNSDSKRDRALHGLYRSLLNNMVIGVSEGFNVTQEVIGVGYKAQAQGQVLELSLGYSHSIFFELPEEIKVETITEKGKNPLRKPEPYKGKGIRFQGEVIRKKAGKAAAK